MINKIVFVVDNILRDYPSLFLLSKILQKNNPELDFEFISTHKMQWYWAFKRNALFVLNKPNLKFLSIRLLRMLGSKVTILNTEGSMGSKFAHVSSCDADYIFFWNRKDYEYFMRFVGKPKQSEIMGCIRTDLLYWSKKVSAGKKKPLLSQNLPRILLTSPGGYLDRSEMEINAKAKQLEHLKADNSNQVDFGSLLEIERCARRNLVELIHYFGERQTPVVIKPHPNESLDYWRSVISNFETVKIRIDPIDEVLRDIDLMIGMTYCQTISDASFSNVLALGINCSESVNVYDPEWMTTATKYIFDDADSVIQFYEANLRTYKQINEVYNNKENQKIIEDFTNKFFYKVDGRRTEAHANKIIDIVVENFNFDQRYNTGILDDVRSTVRAFIIAIKQKEVLNARHSNSFGTLNQDLTRIKEVEERIMEKFGSIL